MTVIVDTGTTFVVVPLSDFTTLQNYWISSLNALFCLNGICAFDGYCSDYYSYFDTIYFSFGDSWFFSFPPSSYLLDSEPYIGEAGACILGIMGVDDTDIPLYILGDSFL